VAREKGGFWLGFTAALFYPITRLLGRWQWEGLERIPAAGQGAALVVANHISYIDPIYTAVFVHRAGRIPRFLAKAGLWRIPMLRPILRATGQIPVYRDSADAQQSLRDGVQALREGKVVVIYPEGTITRDPDHWPMRSHTGVARLALTTDAPVLPVIHWGTQEVYDHYRKRFRPIPRKRIVVRCGPPIDLSAFRDQPVDAVLLRRVTDHVMNEVRELLAKERGEQPPAKFYRPLPTRPTRPTSGEAA
jgi:1-acyl-sn-glycerol-3-phosphate acyltransferase